MTAHDVPDLAYGDAPDAFDSPDGRTYSGLPARRDIHGRPLQPGVNADKVDIAAGLKQARAFGYATTTTGHMVIDYALRRHARGEEDGAQRTALHYGVDLTSWYAILAAALAAAS